MFKLGLQVAAVSLALDQLSKWALLFLVDMPQKQFIRVTDFFNLRMVWNKGVSFGLFSAESDVGRYMLIGFSLLIVAGLVVWLYRAHHTLLACAIGLVIGGALGNVVDRVIFGAVADFFDFHALGYHFFTFNIADTAISIGVALLVIELLFYGDPVSAEAEQKS